MKSKFMIGPDMYVPNLWSIIIISMQKVRTPYSSARAGLCSSAFGRSQKFFLMEKAMQNLYAKESETV